jgi:hypothetical protein
VLTSDLKQKEPQPRQSDGKASPLLPFPRRPLAAFRIRWTFLLCLTKHPSALSMSGPSRRPHLTIRRPQRRRCCRHASSLPHLNCQQGWRCRGQCPLLSAYTLRCYPIFPANLSLGGSEPCPGRLLAALRTTRLTQYPSSHKKITCLLSSSVPVSNPSPRRAPPRRRWMNASLLRLRSVNCIPAPWAPRLELSRSVCTPMCPVPTVLPSVQATLGSRPALRHGRVANLGDR